MAYLIIFCSIALLSLLVVSIANQREERLRSRRIRLHKLKLRVDELESLLLQVSALVESPDILTQINDEIIDMYQMMIELDSSLPYLEAALNTAESRNLELAERQALPNRMMESDAKIAMAQKHLTEAAKVIRHRQSHNKITLEEMQAFLKELSYQHLMVDVISMVGQGHKATNKSNLFSAQAYYKKARQMLVQSTHSDPRRHEMSRQLVEIIEGNRQTISQALMPETQFNPDRQASADEPILDDILSRNDSRPF